MGSWVKSLNVGDKMVRSVNNFGSRVVRVAKILPSGRIKTDDGEIVKENGSLAGGGDWNTTRFEPYTEAWASRFKRSKMIKQIEATKWGALTDAEMEAAYKIFKSAAERAEKESK